MNTLSPSFVTSPCLYSTIPASNLYLIPHTNQFPSNGRPKCLCIYAKFKLFTRTYAYRGQSVEILKREKNWFEIFAIKERKKNIYIPFATVSTVKQHRPTHSIS